MKFLRIGDDMYINTERIDGISRSIDGRSKVLVGGSDEAWTVGGVFTDGVLELIQGEADEQRKGEE